MDSSSDREIDLIAEEAAGISSTTAEHRLGESNNVGANHSTYLHGRFRNGATAGERRVLVTLGVIFAHLHPTHNAGVPALAPETLEIERPREPMELDDEVSEAGNSTDLGQDSRTMDWKNETGESVEPMETSARSSSPEAMELGSSNSSAVEVEERARPSQPTSPEAMEMSASSEGSRTDESTSQLPKNLIEERRRAGKRKMIENDGPSAKMPKVDDTVSTDPDSTLETGSSSPPAPEEPEEAQPHTPTQSTASSPSSSTTDPVYPIDETVTEADIGFIEERDEPEDPNAGNSLVQTPGGSNRPQLDTTIPTTPSTSSEADIGFIEERDEQSQNQLVLPSPAITTPEVEDNIGNFSAGVLAFKSPPAKIGRFDSSEDSTPSSGSRDDSRQDVVDEDVKKDESTSPVAPTHGLDDADVTPGAELFKGPSQKVGRYDDSSSNESSSTASKVAEESDEADIAFLEDHDEEEDADVAEGTENQPSAAIPDAPILEEDTPESDYFEGPPPKRGKYDDSEEDSTSPSGDEDGSGQNGQMQNSPVPSNDGDIVASTSDDIDITPGVFAFDTPRRKVGRFDDSASSSVDLDDRVGNGSGIASPVFDAPAAHVNVADADADADADSIGDESDDDQHAAASDFDSDTLDDQNLSDQHVAGPDWDFDDPVAHAEDPIDEPEDSPPSSPDSNSYVVNSPDATPPPMSPVPGHPGDDDEDPDDEEDPEGSDSDSDDDEIPIELEPEHFSAHLLNLLPGLVDQNEIGSCDAGRWIGAKALFFALLREATTFNIANINTGRRCAVLHTSAFEEAKRLVGEDLAEKERRRRLKIRGAAPVTQIGQNTIARWVVYGNEWSEMLIPINIDGDHWAIVVVKRQSVQAVVLDSNPNLQDADQKPVKEMVKGAVKKLLEGIGALNRTDKTTHRFKIRYTRSDCREVQLPQSEDCGIFVISHARKVLARASFNGKTKEGESKMDIGNERQCLKRMLVKIRREYGGQVLAHQPGSGQLPCCPKKVPITLSYSGKH